MWQGINIVHLVVNEHGPIFADVLDLLEDVLGQIGVPVRRSVNRLERRWLNLLVGHTMFVPEEELRRIRGSRCSYVVFQVEALDDAHGFAPRFPGYFDLLRGAIQIWDYSHTNADKLAAKGFTSVRYLPLGYSTRLERIEPAVHRPVDVVFVGSRTPRRSHIFEGLRAAGLQVNVLFGAYGSERDRAFATAKIVLNLHQFETSQLEQVRISYLLNNRSFIISERADCDPYGGGVIFSDYEQIVNCCQTYLQHSQLERDRIAELGYQHLRNAPMSETMKNLWRECVTDAVVRLDNY
jgi:hypothetical protein